MSDTDVRGKHQGPRTVRQPRTHQGTQAPPRERQIIDAHLRTHIDPERRRAMVAEAAWFFAERRDFEPGYELNDWLAAEDQIDAALRLADMEAAALLREQGR